MRVHTRVLSARIFVPQVAVQKTRTGCYAYVLVWKLLNKLGWQIYRHAQNVVLGADGRMNTDNGALLTHSYHV